MHLFYRQFQNLTAMIFSKLTTFKIIKKWNEIFCMYLFWFKIAFFHNKNFLFFEEKIRLKPINQIYFLKCLIFTTLN